MTSTEIRAALAQVVTVPVPSADFPGLYIKRWPLPFYFLVSAEFNKPTEQRDWRPLQIQAMYLSLCAEDGTLLFTPEKPNEFTVEGLLNLPGPLCEDAFEKMLQLNGFIKVTPAQEADNSKNSSTTGS